MKMILSKSEFFVSIIISFLVGRVWSCIVNRGHKVNDIYVHTVCLTCVVNGHFVVCTLYCPLFNLLTTLNVNNNMGRMYH